ncbi:MAG: BrxA/BrxB family bacilliredoxin [Calditrichaeota bacterium]|nr:BrxA/BrxB family bacilliredoxin [Calditrichota bacterium]
MTRPVPLSLLDSRPTYEPDAVRPLREELIAVGFRELLTPEEVDAALTLPSGNPTTTLVVVNSVCGCAAGNARPGAALGLQHRVIPDRLLTVFAGMEKAAVQRVRDYLTGYPPSSPAMALFKGPQLVHILERRDIEQMSADDIALSLRGAFGQHCAKPGPSIPPEVFAGLEMVKYCGSKIPLYRG